MKNQFPTFGRSKVLFSLMLPPELADPVIIILQHYPWGVLLPAMSIKTNALAVAPMLSEVFFGGTLNYSSPAVRSLYGNVVQYHHLSSNATLL
jgi:hypothetical protein